MKVLFIIFLISIVNNRVTSEICSYYQEVVNDGTHWKCDIPLKNVTAVFVTDIAKSVIPALNREVLAPFGVLTHIHIGKCDIETIASDTFTGYPLKSLFLNSNNIKKIEKGTLNSLNLTTSFEMTFNQLEVLEDNTFFGMSALVWMSLSANKISKIEKNAFNGLVNLDSLFLASNNIKTLDTDTFKPLKKLSLLEISHNQLAHIPVEMFSHLSNLQKLLLEHNQIEMLPDRLFDKISGLSTLDISQNKISKIQDSLFGQVLENFKEFKIYSNKITRFNATNFFIRAPKIKEIELYDNPWYCAELERLRGEFLKKKVFIPIPVRVQKKPNVDGIACIE